MESIKMVQKKEMMIKETAEVFIKRCRIKNLSERTIKYYYEKLGYFYRSY